MKKHTGMQRRAVWAAMVAGALALATSSAADANGPKRPYAIAPGGTAKFVPLDPKEPKGTQISIISGDLKTGPVALLFKLNKGAVPVHWHTSDYYAVVIEGRAKHWLAGQDVPAKANGVGTAWFQPGGSAATAHGDECVTDSCTVFVYLEHGVDYHPPASPSNK